MAEYIDKQKLMENFAGYDLTQCQKYGNTSQKQRDMSYDTMMMYEIADEIDCAPAADVAPVVHGHWIRQDESFTRFKCSNPECGAENYGGFENYCPNCGAKMGEDG